MVAARDSRKAKDSRVEMVEIMFPNDANALGTVMGGRVMHLIDVAAAIAASRHARRLCVTASVDRLDFHSAVNVGDLLILLASVNYVGKTSMEVGVRVEVEDRTSGQRRHTSTAYLTFVAIDENRHPVPAPLVIPETPEEIRRYKAAEERRRLRLAALGKNVPGAP